MATSSITPSTPTVGVGRMGAVAVWLYSDTLPPVTGTPSSRHPSTSPITASANCHITSGSSGEPKLRQSVMATGSAPVTATLR